MGGEGWVGGGWRGVGGEDVQCVFKCISLCSGIILLWLYLML